MLVHYVTIFYSYTLIYRPFVAAMRQYNWAGKDAVGPLALISINNNSSVSGGGGDDSNESSESLKRRNRPIFAGLMSDSVLDIAHKYHMEPCSVLLQQLCVNQLYQITPDTTHAQKFVPNLETNQLHHQSIRQYPKLQNVNYQLEQTQPVYEHLHAAESFRLYEDSGTVVKVCFLFTTLHHY